MYVLSNAYSNYHGLAATLRRRMSYGRSLNAAWGPLETLDETSFSAPFGPLKRNVEHHNFLSGFSGIMAPDNRSFCKATAATSVSLRNRRFWPTRAAR